VDVTLEKIVGDIRAMGVRAGDVLVVHSSLKSIGNVIGGAPTVARALVKTVSPGGTVFVPTFNFGQFPWDPKTTPSVVGAVTEAFRHLPEAKRSLQCTHPLSAIGPRADEILAGHEKTHPFAVDSPLGKLWKLNAWVLLLGCGHNSSSMIHVAEENVDVPYLYRTRVQTIIDGDRTREVTLRRPGRSNGFFKIDVPLRERGAVIDGLVGAAPSMLMRANDIVETASEMLRNDPTALLCDDPACESCVESRLLIANPTKGTQT
jgi:aminoglycoside 3-N-acetyltransferase